MYFSASNDGGGSGGGDGDGGYSGKDEENWGKRRCTDANHRFTDYTTNNRPSPIADHRLTRRAFQTNKLTPQTARRTASHTDQKTHPQTRLHKANLHTAQNRLTPHRTYRKAGGVRCKETADGEAKTAKQTQADEGGATEARGAAAAGGGTETLEGDADGDAEEETNATGDADDDERIQKEAAGHEGDGKGDADDAEGFTGDAQLQRDGTDDIHDGEDFAAEPEDQSDTRGDTGGAQADLDDADDGGDVAPLHFAGE